MIYHDLAIHPHSLEASVPILVTPQVARSHQNYNCNQDVEGRGVVQKGDQMLVLRRLAGPRSQCAQQEVLI